VTIIGKEFFKRQLTLTHIESVREENTCIEYESPPVGIRKDEIISKINSLVSRMHSLGYTQQGEFVILDHDTVYKINEGPVDWLSEWMQIAFDWEDSFEEFVAYDYDNWRSDWLS